MLRLIVSNKPDEALALIGWHASDFSDLQECPDRYRPFLSATSQRPFFDMRRGGAESELRTQPFVEFTWPPGAPVCT